MNVKEIKVQVQLSISREINLQYLLKFANEAMHKLAIKYDTACKREFMTIEGIEEEWINLPSDCLGIIDCKVNGNKFTDFNVNYGQIKFPTANSFDVAYVRYPTTVSSESDIPEVNLAYHYAIVSFIAARELQRLFGDENRDSVRLMQEYTLAADETNVRLSRMNRVARRVTANASLWR